MIVSVQTSIWKKSKIVADAVIGSDSHDVSPLSMTAVTVTSYTPVSVNSMMLSVSITLTSAPSFLAVHS